MKKQHPLTIRRKKMGLSRPQLAKKLGAHRMTVYRWEAGSNIPRMATLAKIRKETGLKPVEILAAALGGLNADEKRRGARARRKSGIDC